MILSNVAIHQALDDRHLVIDPEPTPRVSSGSDYCPYQTSSVDLRLADEVSYFREDTPFAIDLRRGRFAHLFARNSETKQLTEDQPLVLKPYRMVLGMTLERIELPVTTGQQCLAARIEGKSSYARCGLLVHFTAPTIHAGFSGTLTLELINFGPHSIELYPETPICQLIIETVTGYLEKLVLLVFRGTLRDLSIGGRGLTINGLRYS